MFDAFEAAPSILTGMVIEHFRGACYRVDPTSTAYPYRDPGYNLVLSSQWSHRPTPTSTWRGSVTRSRRSSHTPRSTSK
jgi:hypothetical protein